MLKELSTPLNDVAPDHTCLILFAALIAPGQRTRVHLQQLDARVGGPNLSGEPAVKQTLEELLKKLRD